jgi:hypothetical protein
MRIWVPDKDILGSLLRFEGGFKIGKIGDLGKGEFAGNFS